MKVIISSDIFKLNNEREAYKTELRAKLEDRKKTSKRYFIISLIVFLSLVVALLLYLWNVNIVTIETSPLLSMLAALIAVPLLLSAFVMAKVFQVPDFGISSDEIEERVITTASQRYGKSYKVLEALNGNNIVGVKFIDEPYFAAVFYIKDESGVVSNRTDMVLRKQLSSNESLSGYFYIDVINQRLIHYFKEQLPVNVIIDVEQPLGFTLGTPGKGRAIRSDN